MPRLVAYLEWFLDGMAAVHGRGGRLDEAPGALADLRPGNLPLGRLRPALPRPTDDGALDGRPPAEPGRDRAGPCPPYARPGAGQPAPRQRVGGSHRSVT